MRSLLYCKLISSGGESYGAVRLCSSPVKSRLLPAAPPRLTPAFSAAWGTLGTGADEAGAPSQPLRIAVNTLTSAEPLKSRRRLNRKGQG